MPFRENQRSVFKLKINVLNKLTTYGLLMGVRHLHELHCAFAPSQTKTGGNVFSLKLKRFFRPLRIHQLEFS